MSTEIRSDVGPEELSSLIDAIIRFVETRVLTRESELGLERPADAHTAAGGFTEAVIEARRDIRIESAEAGFYTLFGSPELGGGGLGATAAVQVQEALNRRFGPPRPLLHDVVIPSPFTNGLTPVLEFLPEATRARYLDDIAEGRATLCFGLSEPDAGSDAFAIQSRAVRRDGRWSITGRKVWITNSPYADHALIFAVTDPDQARAREGGITGFFVSTAAPGFEVRPMGGMMGNPGSDLGELTLNDVRVDDDHVLGEVGSGLKIALHGIDRGRLSMASSCVGQALWALDLATDYANERVTFGRAIGDHQAIQMLLADAAMDIFAAKGMVAQTAERIDDGQPAVMEICMSKAYATEMLFRVADRAIQVHGAIGLTNEFGIERLLRHARIMRTPDGTGEIQRRTVARRLLDGDRAI